jgi:hypothetical protein
MSSPNHSPEHKPSRDGTVRVDAEVIRLHLVKILASAEFSASRRSSALLKHIVECALADDFGMLKERLLGVELFGRTAGYDTGGDAIVRVTANDVRRRLACFYGNHPEEPIHICLPLGSYVPALDWRARARLDSNAQG